MVERIPKSFVYDREGKLVAQSIRHAHAQRVSADAGGLWVELVCVGADAFVRPASESERGAVMGRRQFCFAASILIARYRAQPRTKASGATSFGGSYALSCAGPC